MEEGNSEGEGRNDRSSLTNAQLRLQRFELLLQEASAGIVKGDPQSVDYANQELHLAMISLLKYDSFTPAELEELEQAYQSARDNTSLFMQASNRKLPKEEPQNKAIYSLKAWLAIIEKLSEKVWGEPKKEVNPFEVRYL